jgi:phage terminase small subunit
MEEPKINEKLKRVAKFYMGEHLGNATQACLAAGYAKGYARGHACQIVAKKEVQDYIEYIKFVNASKEDKEIATIGDIQAFWSEIMNNVGLDVKDRLKASELLAKSQGAFNNDW